jgi:hypothetical protein
MIVKNLWRGKIANIFMVHRNFMKTIALVSEFSYYGRISTSKIENADYRNAATAAKISP